MEKFIFLQEQTNDFILLELRTIASNFHVNLSANIRRYIISNLWVSNTYLSLYYMWKWLTWIQWSENLNKSVLFGGMIRLLFINVKFSNCSKIKLLLADFQTYFWLWRTDSLNLFFPISRQLWADKFGK